MTERRLVLASTSKYRRALLDQLGLRYEATAHECDEDAFKHKGLGGAALAPILARAKAESLAEAFPDAWILGSDQVAVLGSEILSKPGTAERALGQLRAMSGQTHELITAVALRCPDGRVLEAVEVHRLTMRAFDEGALARYIAQDQPLDCCGSYRIEGLGIALFERIEGHDHTAIVGLPLMAVSAMLRAEGWALP